MLLDSNAHPYQLAMLAEDDERWSPVIFGGFHVGYLWSRRYWSGQLILEFGKTEFHEYPSKDRIARVQEWDGREKVSYFLYHDNSVLAWVGNYKLSLSLNS